MFKVQVCRWVSSADNISRGEWEDFSQDLYCSEKEAKNAISALMKQSNSAYEFRVEKVD